MVNIVIDLNSIRAQLQCLQLHWYTGLNHTKDGYA